MSGSQDQANTYVRRGARLLEVKRPQPAIEQFERALALQPDSAIILCHLSRAFLLLNDYQRSLEYAQRAVAADPNEEWAFRLQAYCYLEKGAQNSAYRAATRAVALEPENADCLYTLAQCAFHLNRHEEARMLGEILVGQDPECTYGHRMLADIAATEKQLPVAAASYEKVLELDPDDDGAMTALAAIKNAHNKFRDSVWLLRGAVNIDPNSATRQSVLRDSMARFALFGQAHERRKSVGGLLVGIFVAYLVFGFLLFRYIEPTTLLRQAFLAGLLLLMMVGLPGLRAQVLAAQSAQLHALHQSISRRQRKRTVLASAVIALTAYGIAALVYFDVGDPEVFYFPLVLLLWAMWIYMAAIALRLFSLWLSDLWLRLQVKNQPDDKRRPNAVLLTMPIITGVALIIVLINQNPVAIFIFFAGFVLTGIVYLGKFPLASGIAALLGGLGLMLIEMSTQQDYDEMTIAKLGLVIAVVGLVAVLLTTIRRVQRRLQRRRIGKLVGWPSAPTDQGRGQMMRK